MCKYLPRRVCDTTSVQKTFHLFKQHSFRFEDFRKANYFVKKQTTLVLNGKLLANLRKSLTWWASAKEVKLSGF